VLRGNRGEAAGTKPGSSFVERITLNTGIPLALPAVDIFDGPDAAPQAREQRDYMRVGTPISPRLSDRRWHAARSGDATTAETAHKIGCGLAR
jgi:hypothetical protein